MNRMQYRDALFSWVSAEKGSTVIIPKVASGNVQFMHILALVGTHCIQNES